jgi:hypothetical protein
MAGTPSAFAAELPADVAVLVEQLGSKDYKLREQAYARLNARGPADLPALKVALVATASPEVHRRLETLIDKQRMEQLVSASRVTLSARNQPMKEVLADICRQAGYTLSEGVGDNAKVTIELKNVPFWEAVEKVTAGSGVTTTFQDDDRMQLNAYFGNQANPHVDTAGPFRFVASNINSSRNIQLGNIPLRGDFRQQGEYLNLNVMLHAEPKSPVVSVGTACIVEAVDDLGGSLAPRKPDGLHLPETRFYNGGMYRSLNQSFSVNLARGDRRATSIKELAGKVNLLLLQETRAEMEIDRVLDPGKKMGQTAEVEFEVAEFAEANGGYAATLILKPRGKRAQDYGWWGNVYQRLELHDVTGRKFLPNGIHEQTVANDKVTMKMSFIPPDGKVLGKPRKLVLMEWITVEKEFEFKFKNVPLP